MLFSRFDARKTVKSMRLRYICDIICSMNINWIMVSVISQIMLFVYFQIVEWMNLFPWNDTSKSAPQRPLDIVFGIIQLIFIYAFFKGVWWLMVVGLGLYAIWLVLQIVSWWLPYLWRASERQIWSYRWYYRKTYKFKFLPPRGDRPIPDANHVVLQFLILIVVITAGLAFFTF